MQPYIGVTGFMRWSEVQQALFWIPEDETRLLMVGVLVSDKTLYGLANKHPRRFPPIESVPSLFSSDPRALNLVHFNTHDQGLLLEQMLMVRMRAGENFHGFQLNVAWPEVRVLRIYRSEHREAVIVLQLGGGAMKEIGYNTSVLTQRLRHYDGLIDYILIDPSGGLGLAFDATRAIKELTAIRNAIPNLGLGLAGGLGPDTIGNIEEVVREFPNLSIDAEGKIRDEDDNLDLRKAHRYVQGALEIFHHYDRVAR